MEVEHTLIKTDPKDQGFEALNAPASSRRWQCSLKTLLSGITLLCGGFSWSAYCERTHQDAAEAWKTMDSLRHSGTFVEYSAINTLSLYNVHLMGRFSRFFDPICQRIGPTHSGNLFVDLGPFSGTDIARLPFDKMRNLHCLSISTERGGYLNDEGLALVAKLDSVEHLRLNHLNLNGSFLQYFKKHGIKEIDVTNNPIATSSLLHLHDYRDLEELWLENCNIEDDDLKFLAKHPSLEKIILTDNQIHGPGLKYLESIPKLKYLYLSKTPLELVSSESKDLEEFRKNRPDVHLYCSGRYWNLEELFK